MAYTPNPTDPTQPVDSVFASTAAAEFRTLKAYIQTLVQGTGQLAGFRNICRNGDFLFNQRQAGVVSTTNNYVVDAWKLFNTPSNRISGNRDNTTFPSNFEQVLKLAVTTAGAIVAGDVYGLSVNMEAIDTGTLLYGTPNAKVTTISFWVYCSQPGEYGVAIRNAANSRSYVAPFNVLIANTWEKKTLTIPGDTGGAGSWPSGTSAISHVISLVVAAGSSYQTASPNQWLAGNLIATTNQQQLSTIGGGVMYLAEFQWEQSSFATPFEYLPASLAQVKCQRYYEGGFARHGGYSAAGVTVINTTGFRVGKRTNPTIGLTTVLNANTSAPTFVSTDSTGCQISAVVTATAAFDYAYNWTADADI